MNVFEYSPATPDWTDDSSSFFSRRPEAFPALVRRPRGEFAIPSGLVVSDDHGIRGVLGEVLLLCGVAPVFADTIEHAAPHIADGNFNFVISQDTLPDGKYADLLLLQHAAGTDSPLIVVSPTGDWPEYFEAVDLGAHDFLAYPLIPGELQRIIRTFLDKRRQSLTSAAFD